MKVVFSPEVSAIAGYAREEAMRTGSYGISADHLMLAILRHAQNGACNILESLGVDAEAFKNHIDSCIFKEKPIPYNDFDKIRLTRGAQSVLNIAAFETLRTGIHEIAPEHILMALVRDIDCCSSKFLISSGITREAVEKSVRALHSAGPKQEELRQEKPSVPVKDIAGALGEQLGNLLESIGNKSNFLS